MQLATFVHITGRVQLLCKLYFSRLRARHSSVPSTLTFGFVLRVDRDRQKQAGKSKIEDWLPLTKRGKAALIEKEF